MIQTITECLMFKLKEIDAELTHINIEVQIAEVKTEKKSAYIKK